MSTSTKPACPLCRDRGVFARWSIELPGGNSIEPDSHESRMRDGEEITPDDAPYWAPGQPMRYASQHFECEAEHATAFAMRGFERHATRWTETAPCSCTAKRSTYDERKAARADRREERAEALAEQATADIRRASDMLPDFGQPILVGHHSERGHRSLLARSEATMRRGIQAHKDSQRLGRMADSARASSEISAEDPHAPAKLRAQAWAREWRQDEMKAANKRARKDGRERVFERYELTNNGSQIRRLRKRADELEAARALVVPEDLEVGDFTVSWNRPAHRVQVFSPKPATKATREAQSTAMRRAGFRWARSEGCWQRHAGRPAWDAAVAVATRLSS